MNDKKRSFGEEKTYRALSRENKRSFSITEIPLLVTHFDVVTPPSFGYENDRSETKNNKLDNPFLSISF
jgi:hypothetical protein